MAFSRFSAAALGFGAAIALLSGCAQQSNSSASVVPASLAGQTSGKVHGRAAKNIQNLIVIVRQHRSFENLFFVVCASRCMQPDRFVAGTRHAVAPGRRCKAGALHRA
jgi:hypothetical protein